MPSTSQNHLIARCYLSDLWSRGLLATADAIVAPSCELQDPLCGLRRGPDAIKAAVCELRLPFPDLAFSLDDVIVDAGDQLALSWTAHGTHRAPLLGIPATARRFHVSGMLLLRFRTSKLIAITMCWEPTELLQQLGLLGAQPAPRSRLARGSSNVPVAPPAREETRVPPSEQAGRTVSFALTQPESELDAGWV